MKKNSLYIIVYILTFAVTAVNLSYAIKGSLFSDINSLPEGNMVSCTLSPKKDRKINVYVVKNALGEAVRAECSDSEGKTENVFWQTGISKVDVYWQGNTIAVINGIPIDVGHGGYYDCRRGKSLFQSGAIEGEGFVDEQGYAIPQNK